MYSGRIEKYKNIDLLAKIVKQLNDIYGMKLKLLVVGNGSYKEKLLKKLREIRVDHEYMPFQSYEKYLELLSYATFFGLLSKKESYPQSINEANAIGVPAVVAKPWGLNFAGRKRTLVLDTSFGASEIARQVYRFLARVKNEEKSEVPTWNEVTLKYLELYSS
jgi:glycosyltransferase involved in cell wall biosynthesis